MNEIKKILQSILNRLQEPFVADSQALHFIESSLGWQPYEITNTLLEESGIIELVVVPDEHFRKSIEPDIHPEGLSPHTIKEIEDKIKGSMTHISLDIAGNTIYIAPSYCDEFINKLYLQKQNIVIPDNTMSLQKYIAARVAIRVYAKNHDLQVLQKITDALVKDKDELLLYHTIQLFTHIVYNETDLYTQLSMHKQRLQKQLWDMYEFQKLMEVYSMEFLMSARKTAPIVDSRKVLYDIKLIDTMCVALYGTPAQSFISEVEIDNKNISDMLNTI